MTKEKVVKQPAVIYHPRNDMVLVRKVKRGLVRGLAMPDVSGDSFDWIVEALGDKVQDLAVGDKVMLGVNNLSEAYQMPRCTDLFMVKQEAVITRIEEPNEVITVEGTDEGIVRHS